MNQALEQILQAKKSLGSAMDPEYSERHSQLVAKLQQLIQNVQQDGLFSSNEEMDDVSTNSLKYMNLWYLMGELLDSSKVDSTRDHVVDRMHVLQRSIRAYLNFLGLLDNYGILLSPIKQFLGKVSPNFQFDLNEVVKASKNPSVVRQQKIERYSLQKGTSEEYREKAALLHSKDEELQRQAWQTKLRYESVEAWQSIANNTQELELLASMGSVGVQDALTEGKLPRNEQTMSDLKKVDQSIKVEIEPVQQARGPIMGPKGKVLRPFTLTRTQAQSQVLGTGQVLPSMSVEEFVEQELANGGMLKPQEPEKEDDEDDHRYQDQETERLRKWDEFTEANPKGSGNTMNLG